MRSFYRYVAFAILGIFEEISDNEYHSHSEYYHQYRPELRGSDASDKLAARVVSKIFNEKAEDSIGYEIQTEVVLEVFFQYEICGNGKENEQKCRLVKLSGMYGL